MRLEDFSALTLAWRDMAMTRALDEFKRQALEALQAQLPFASAWWGVGVRGRPAPRIVQSYLYGLPEAFVSGWQAIAEHDGTAQRVQQVLGVTVLDNELAGMPDSYLAFSREFDLASALCTSMGNEEIGIGSFLSLYRGFGQPPFGEAERLRMQLLTPHLMNAADDCWRRGLHAQLQHSHTAFADAGHRLQDAGVEFYRALLGEWPDWQGGRLPPALSAAVSQQRGRWDGKTCSVNCALLPEGRVRLEIFPRRSHGLSASQERVARLYAAGASYKEIARDLGLSPATVRTYLRECYLKLGVSNKIELGSKVG